MPYVKIPLKMQLNKIAKGLCVHPEYMPAAIRAWADMPISAYLGAESRRRDFRRLLVITEEEESTMTYSGAVSRIGPWFDDDRFVSRTHQALRLLAEPLHEAYRRWEGQQDETDTT